MSTPSANGATLTGPTDTGSLTDGTGATWTLKGGIVYRDSVATISAAVTLLLYFGDVIYQQAHGEWWGWVNGAWDSIPADPRPATPPLPAPPTFTQALAPGQSIAVTAEGSMTVTISA